ncbi:MAG TPA: response regulator [Rhodospirillales bacterium]|nr:response regulator [Rhodospirillales bacterium]
MTSILLVDDSATILMSMSSILGRAGYQVEQAESGEAAMGKLKGGIAPKLIITDFNMPGMNGAQLIGEARKLAALRFVPMLVLTTESQQSKRDEAKAAGATGWLVKPVDPGQLLAVIKQLIPGA